jgi:hypothetical protein
MKTLHLATAGVLMAAAGGVSVLFNDVSPAFAQPSSVCLRNNQIWSTSAINSRTLVVNDRAGRSFAVELSGGCQGLNSNFQPISFNTRTSLGCLGAGDRVSFRHPTLGRNTCFVRNVSPLTTVASANRPFRRARVSWRG